MHAGQFTSLEDVLHHYNKAPAAPEGHTELERLNFTEKQIEQIIRFLTTLDGPIHQDNVSSNIR